MRRQISFLLMCTFLLPAGLRSVRGETAEQNNKEPVATASAWPQFKGDSLRSGNNPAAKLKLPLTRSTAIQFPAPIYASPAVIGNRVYIQDAYGNVACIDSSKNSVVWTAAGGGINNMSSPAVVDGKVFIGSTTGALNIYSTADGKLLKRVPTEGKVICSPAATADAVFFNTDEAHLYKIDFEGNVKWVLNSGTSSYVPVAVRGKRIIFLAGRTRSYLYRVEDHGDKGEIIARDKASGGYNCPVSGPVFLGDETYAYQSYDSESGHFFAFERTISPGSNDSRCTASVRGNRLYRGNLCFEFDTEARKAKTIWQLDVNELYDGGFHSSPALSENFQVIGSELGQVFFIPLEGKKKGHKSQWKYAISNAGRPNGAVSSSPAVVDGKVFFGGEDGILYGLSNGPQVDVAAIQSPTLVTDSPAPKTKLTGHDWPTTGGGMGFHCVAKETTIRPPFKIRWKTKVWSSFKGNMILGDGRVYCAGRMGPVMALDAASGEILWKAHHAGVESRPSPTYYDGHLLVLRIKGGLKTSPYYRGHSGGPDGNGLYCHDAATGKQLWYHPIDVAYQFNSDGVTATGGKVLVCEAGPNDEMQAVAYDVKTGKQQWRTTIEGVAGRRKVKGLNRPRRFSGVISGGLWCVSIRGTDKTSGATLAIDPSDGTVRWKNDTVFITERSRVAARNNTFVVFSKQGYHALEPTTGKQLWHREAITKGKLKPASTHYMQALTDKFLESKGMEEVFHTSGCILPIYANGNWYLHTNNSSYRMSVLDGETRKLLWSRTFLSHACPSPVPAYDKLYYAPNAEGVVYCFENDESESSEKAGGR